MLTPLAAVWASTFLEGLEYPVDRSVLTQWAKAGYQITKPLVNALAGVQ